MNTETLANKIQALTGSDIRTIKEGLLPYNANYSSRKLIAQITIKLYAIKILKGEQINPLEVEIKGLDKQLKEFDND
jgi:hypothetical protein